MYVANELLGPVRRLEHYRRALGYLRAHHAQLVAAGASKRELSTLAETIDEHARIIALSEIHPLDTPVQEPEPPQEEQPLCPEGAEQTIADIFEIALGDAA